MATSAQASQLPRTGSDTAVELEVAGGLLALGGAAIVLSRRRAVA